jgi:YhcH/YjgK/YiaL family protein
MIIDTLDNCEKYFCIHPGFADAFHFLKHQPSAPVIDQNIPVKNGRIQAMYMQRVGKTRNAARLEAHLGNIDIQFLISGEEEFGWKPTAQCAQPDGDFMPERDVQFFNDTPDSWHLLRPSQFVVFFPEDAHAPMVSQANLSKVVIKVVVASA